MFDTVGRDLDAGARRRSVVSGLITTTLMATGVATLALWGLLNATERVLSVPEDRDLVIVEVEDPVLDEAPPAPPAAPAPEGAGTPDAPDEPPPPEAPAPDDPAPLDDEVANEVQSTRPGGPGTGDGPGKGDGDGDGRGTGGSGTAEGPVALHHSELVVKRRVKPEFPEAAKAAGVAEGTCRVRVFIDREGRPVDLRFEACPRVFQEATEDAVMRWRWYPAEVGGEPVPAQFLLSVQYRMR